MVMKINPSLKGNGELIKDFQDKFTEVREGHHVINVHPYKIVQWLRVAFRRVEARKE